VTTPHTRWRTLAEDGPAPPGIIEQFQEWRQGLLIWEDVSATPFAKAMRNSGGVLIEGSPIPTT
jgi:hypothetical protein